MGSVLFALVGGLLSAWLTGFVSKRNNEAQLLAQKELQEDAQNFSDEQRVEQNEYEQQMLEFNAVNLPSLQKQGYVSAGMSEAGAIQALAGGSSVGYSPVTTTSSPIATAPSMNQSTSSFQGIADALNSYFENSLKEQQREESESNVVFNQQMVDESIKRGEKMAFDMNLASEQLDAYKSYVQSQVGLNESLVREHNATVRRINTQIQTDLALIDNLNVDTALKYVQQSKVIAETGLIQAQTEYTSTNTRFLDVQIEGQEISNKDARIVLQFKQRRIELAKIMGFDPDSEPVEQVLEAMALGRWDSVDRIIEATSMTNGTVLDGVFKLGSKFKHGNRFSSFLGFNSSGYRFSPSFQSSWNPN